MSKCYLITFPVLLFCFLLFSCLLFYVAYLLACVSLLQNYTASCAFCFSNCFFFSVLFYNPHSIPAAAYWNTIREYLKVNGFSWLSHFCQHTRLYSHVFAKLCIILQRNKHQNLSICPPEIQVRAYELAKENSTQKWDHFIFLISIFYYVNIVTRWRNSVHYVTLLLL